MILGLGTDISSIAEFNERLLDPASSFIDAHFTKAEIDYCRAQTSGNPAQHFAARYSAKEAVIKALDQARKEKFPPIKVDYKEIEVFNDGSGRPEITLHGDFMKMSKALGIRNMVLSVSHDRDYATAVVIVE